MQLQSGTHLKRGDYRIIDSLGRGGFGITYLAEQVNLHRKVCIKEFWALLDSEVPVVDVLVADDEKTNIAPQTPTQKQDEKKPKPKKCRWWLWILGLLVAFGGVLFMLCEKNEEKEIPQTSAPYKVGDYYNENGKRGVVFEVSDGGRHGKIVSLDETEAPWDSRVVCDGGYENYFNGTVTEANSWGDGKANTDKIMSRSDREIFIPFVWCRKKGDDWYLPASEELKTIYKNKSAINSTLTEYGGAKLRSKGAYWSSTEEEKFNAWVALMRDGLTYFDPKSDVHYVRAVSAF